MAKKTGKKQTAKHHKDVGNFRPSRHAGPDLTPTVPPAPKGMNTQSKAIWKKVTQLLLDAKLITVLDEFTVRILCESVDIYLQAIKMIETEGITITNVTARGESTTVHPAIKVRNDAWSQIEKLSKEFGMTALSRTGILAKGGGRPGRNSKDGEMEHVEDSDKEPDAADIVLFQPTGSA